MNPRKNLWSKTKEIFFEILIIVFSVSLAVYLERQREHSHEQKAVKEFLAGLKIDLRNDISEMNNDKISFQMTGEAFRFVTSVKPGEKLNRDSFNTYYRYMMNTTGLIANNGRYEGFKSSGKITNIENKELQNDILDLYQENIPSLLASTDLYTNRKLILMQYIIDNGKRNKDGSNNVPDILVLDKGQNLCGSLQYVKEITDRYDTVINKSKKIMSLIDEEVK